MADIDKILSDRAEIEALATQLITASFSPDDYPIGVMQARSKAWEIAAMAFLVAEVFIDTRQQWRRGGLESMYTDINGDPKPQKRNGPPKRAVGSSPER